MRFLLPSVPAGRLEYLAILIVLGVVQFFALILLLDLSVDVQSQELNYDATKLTISLCILFVTMCFAWITVLRRLTDLHMSGVWALCLLIPILNWMFQLYLLVASGVRRETIAPYGDDPYNPDSWVQKPAIGSTGPAVTYRGQALTLPGEENWASDDAA